MKRYEIVTNFNLLKDGEVISEINTQENFVEFTLQIVFLSSVPFTLEIGLMDHFHGRFFEIKEDTGFRKDDIFELHFPKTGETEFQESNLTVRVDKLKNQGHDLIFFIKNVTKIQNGSIRGYDFLRVSCNSSMEERSVFSDHTELPFAAAQEKAVFLELHPVVKKHSTELECKLQFNIDKIYEGEQFAEEYKNHKKDEIDFAVMVLEENKLLKINGQKECAWSKSSIGKNGAVHFLAASNTSEKTDLVFLLVPYPFQNPMDSQRYQRIAYHTICYYQYKFEESVELF